MQNVLTRACHIPDSHFVRINCQRIISLIQPALLMRTLCTLIEDNMRTLRSAARSNHLAKVNIDAKLMD